jgi:hypothetical protein
MFAGQEALDTLQAVVLLIRLEGKLLVGGVALHGVPAEGKVLLLAALPRTS